MGHRTHAAQLLFVFVFSTVALTAHAAVYRCGTSYQDTPCAGGSTIEAEDPRSSEQQTEAARAVQKDAAMAETLRKQRVQQEAVEAKQQQAAQTSRAVQSIHQAWQFHSKQTAPALQAGLHPLPLLSKQRCRGLKACRCQDSPAKATHRPIAPPLSPVIRRRGSWCG